MYSRIRRTVAALLLPGVSGLPVCVEAGEAVVHRATFEDFPGWYTETQNPTSDPGEFVPARATLPNVHVSFFDPILPSKRATGSSTSGLSVISDATPDNRTTTGPDAFQYVAWQSLRRDFEDSFLVPVAEDDTLLAVQWTLSADEATRLAADSDRRGTAVQIPTVRLRVGEQSFFGNAQSMDLFVHNGTNAITEMERVITTYHYVETGGNYATNNYDGVAITPADSPVVVGFNFDILDLFSEEATGLLEHPGGHRDYGVTLSRIDVFAVPTGGLSGEEMILNTGAASFETADGSMPPEGAVAFDPAIWQGRVLPMSAPRVNTLPPEDETEPVDRLGIQVSPLEGTYAAVMDTYQYNFFGGGESINDLCVVGNDRLVRIDAWLSTDVTEGDPLPGFFDAITGGRSFARVGYYGDFFGPTGNLVGPGLPRSQGRTGYLEFSMSPLPTLDVFFEIEGVYGLESRPRRISYFFEPNLSVDASLAFRPFLSVYGFDGPGLDGIDLMDGTIFIDRFVVTTFDKPDLASAIR